MSPPKSKLIVKELIEPEKIEPADKIESYDRGEQYWSQVTPDVDGMLGGFAHLSDPDISESHAFLDKVKNLCGTSFGYALDCGAGIGRVTRDVLIPYFDRVDMVDVTSTFIEQSADYIGSELNALVGEKFVCGLQDFYPTTNRYDVIWVQFVCGNIRDVDFVNFLRRCRTALRANGCIIIKDNVCRQNQAVFHDDDHSWTRTNDEYKARFDEAGCRLILEDVQKHWPHFVYPVYMYALQ